MPDLIDRAALLEKIRSEAVNAKELTADRYHPSVMAFGHCHSLLKRAPAVDAVEVVRCKDCRRFTANEDSPELFGYCSLYPLKLTKLATDFCNCGERRTDGKTD